ncbi:MAG TPA: hypothetical protein VK050_08565 [Flavobacteriaceae bacterium]|nr:hypothetical protein [Flavobacteriaceae bacterium]
MKHYILHIIKQNVRFRVTYRNGRFFRLERMSGFLETDDFKHIGQIIPVQEKDIDFYIDTFDQRITYTKPEPKPKTTYQEFVAVWHNFYHAHYGIEPRFNATEGRHLKQLIAYLKKISGTSADALAIWQQLLSNWNKLDKFHQRNADLKYINSNINRIIENVKKPSNTKTSYSDDFKRKITERLRTQ